MESIINYTLRAELYSRWEEKKLQKYLFERKFHIKYIGKGGKRTAVYNTELDLYFQATPVQDLNFEIEVDNSAFILSDELEKSTEFVRRVNYMYDWIQLCVNTEGKVVSIRNEEELIQQWRKMKDKLLVDYRGREVDAYLSKVDERLANSTILRSSVQQYFNFGLVFLPIPHLHKKEWSNKRLIEFSEYEDEKFEEKIIYQTEENGLRKYNINIQSLKDSDIYLEQYEGNVTMPANDIFPISALIEVVFRKDDISNQWYFKLERS